MSKAQKFIAAQSGEKFHIKGRTLFELIASLFTKEKETVYVTKEAIFHELKAKKFSKVSYLPFDKINILMLNKSGFFKRRICAIGELSFSTKYSINSDEAKKLRAEFEKYHSISEGKIYHPNIFSKVKNRKKLSLIFLEDCMVYDDARPAKVTEALFTGPKRTTTVLMKKVSSCKCKPIFSLFKRVAIISGTGSTDLRDNSCTEATVEFPGVFFFSWCPFLFLFGGGLKRKIKKFI